MLRSQAPVVMNQAVRSPKEQFLRICSAEQRMYFYVSDLLVKTYAISTAQAGMGEAEGSFCTPRGWHAVYAKIGMDAAVNSVFVARVFTGEIYSPQLKARFPERDWILSRIIQMDGLEPGKNKGLGIDTLKRYIYIHGTPDETPMGIPGSRGCIRMQNQDIIELASGLLIQTPVYIE